MTTITIGIANPSETEKLVMNVPDDVILKELIEAMVEQMGLPLYRSEAGFHRYHLNARSEDGELIILDDRATLEENNVVNGDVLQLTVEISFYLNKRNPLKVFLCHASDDKQIVRELFHRLRKEGMNPWLDEENLLPGQDWQLEIPNAVRNSDVVIVCLSKGSVTKTGYVQKEIKQALDVADEQPEGSIFLIPLKLEECDVPKRLSRWQWVNLFEDNGYSRLLHALNMRSDAKNNI